MSIKSEVAEILDELMLDVLQEVSKKYGIEIYSQTFPDERAAQILQLLKDKLLEHKSKNYVEGVEDVIEYIPVSEVNKLLGDGK